MGLHHHECVHLRDVEVGYGGQALLPPVSFDIEPGQFWGVIGRNGAGKTTLLRTLLGLLAPVRGRVERAPDMRVGYVPQRADIDLSVPSRVIDIVRTSLDDGWSFLRPFVAGNTKVIVDDALKAAKVDGIARQSFRELSEGQKQRVLLARALVRKPSVLVLDEPTSAMDHETEMAVFHLLDELRAERGMAVVVITHDLVRAAQLSTHLVFAHKDENVVLAGPADDVLSDEVLQRVLGDLASARASYDGERRVPAHDHAHHVDCDHESHLPQVSTAAVDGEGAHG